uniref:P2X purinoreceptor 7 intracellular domain-containing protein n=1 Tax=Hucho hucho TaxID=62062 RepID=A0A4W5MUR9_9TELE
MFLLFEKVPLYIHIAPFGWRVLFRNPPSTPGVCVLSGLITCCSCSRSLCQESVCSQDYQQTTSTMTEEGVGCITQHSGFPTVCQGVNMMHTACNTYRHPADRFRHVAYRQFISWNWVYLGQNSREPMPTCAVNGIRNRLSNENMPYTGFELP